ncbi:hypothetical protein scyTo_0017344 [Scyliorhinus torazame]|uniref:Uncharacterized protein n=1 Tax=Scyliorhinus torazame TaxID=75743 RepID=A0A401PQP5_SCYTO|nr:hypothetical protein [Scyliorhinus torazame]
MHKYLHASVYGSTVFDLTEKDRPHNRATEIQLGRPTRSSLLRARYCSLSTFSDQYGRENKQRLYCYNYISVRVDMKMAVTHFFLKQQNRRCLDCYIYAWTARVGVCERRDCPKRAHPQ